MRHGPPAQRARALADVEQARALGFGEEDLRWLDASEASAVIGLDGMLGATFTPHCAAIQPALLARGLAEAVERRGVSIYEHTEVIDIVAGGAGRSPLVRTTAGAIKADVVVRAVEAWTSTLPGQKRTLVPVYSLMVATEPLGEGFWAEAGLARSGHLHRLPPHDHLRATHGRRPDRLRRARGPVPLRLHRAAVL